MSAAAADILVFDLDETLTNSRTDSVFPLTREILRKAFDEGHRMFVASFNPGAKDTLLRFDLLQFIEDVARFTPGITKAEQIAQLANHHGFDRSRAVLFDDLASNVLLCRAAGIRAVLVDGCRGLTEDNVFERQSADAKQLEQSLRYRRAIEQTALQFQGRRCRVVCWSGVLEQITPEESLNIRCQSPGWTQTSD